MQTDKEFVPPIQNWIFLKYSDQLIYLHCVKEYLLIEIAAATRKQDSLIDQMNTAGLPMYIQNITRRVLSDRIGALKNVLDDVFVKIKKFSSKESIL